MFLITDEGANESYAIVQNESETLWLVIRKRPDEKTGHSPLVAHAETLAMAFTELALVIQRPIGRVS